MISYSGRRWAAFCPARGRNNNFADPVEFILRPELDAGATDVVVGCPASGVLKT